MFFIPETVEYIKIINLGNVKEFLNLPSKLKTLYYCSCDLIDFPDTIEDLTIRSEYYSSLDDIKFPKSLKKIKFYKNTYR